jgi:hypothetical protein
VLIRLLGWMESLGLARTFDLSNLLWLAVHPPFAAAFSASSVAPSQPLEAVTELGMLWYTHGCTIWANHLRMA